MTTDALCRKHTPLADYLAAVEEHAEATRLFYRALRTFAKLELRGVEERRAYDVAGVALADNRMIAMGRAERTAFERLARYTRTLDIVERYLVHGAVLCALWLPEPDNEN